MGVTESDHPLMGPIVAGSGLSGNLTRAITRLLLQSPPIGCMIKLLTGNLRAQERHTWGPES